MKQYKGATPRTAPSSQPVPMTAGNATETSYIAGSDTLSIFHFLSFKLAAYATLSFLQELLSGN